MSEEILKLTETVSPDTCTADNCSKPIERKKYALCENHYYKMRKHGDPNAKGRALAKDTVINIMDSHAGIELSNGGMARIDICDVELVSGYCWSYSSKNNKYVRGYIRGRSVLLHRYLMGEPKNLCVDHINHDPLDNRRANLRICTKQENLWNLQKKSSKNRFKGVSWHKTDKLWKASICKDGKRENIGLFKCETAASHAYDKRALELFGEFAKTNHAIFQAIEFDRSKK